MINSKTLAQTLIKLSQGKDSEKSITTFFEYLKEKNFLVLLPQIKNHIIRATEVSSKANTLVISSKHTLSDTEINEIISLVGADKNVEKDIINDESIVGGFSATYRGNIYDGSLRNQITQLRTRLTH